MPALVMAAAVTPFIFLVYHNTVYTLILAGLAGMDTGRALAVGGGVILIALAGMLTSLLAR